MTKINIIRAALLLGSTAIACPASAQAADSTSQGTTPEEKTKAPAGVEAIVVTAQRRSENLQNVPVSISAVTATTLKNTGVTGLGSIKIAVPALSVENGNGYLILHMRGVGSVGNGPGFENPIALYIDGVYYANQSVGLAQFNNIERIEVLKGPQGTLFGRNATGGLIQVITEDPGQKSKFRADVTYGNYNTAEGSMYVSSPVTSNLAADLGVRFGRHDGYGTNLVNDEGIDGVKHDVAARSKVVWTPADLKFTLIGDYNDRVDTSNALPDVEGSSTFAGTPPVTYPNPWDARLDTQPRLHIRGGGVSLKGEGKLGEINVSDLVAYRSSLFDNTFDYDGSQYPLTAIRIYQKDKQFSNELQFSSNDTGRLTWLAGAYYFWARGEMDPLKVSFAPTTDFNPNFPLVTILNSGRQDTRSISGFGQATFRLTDKIRITGGARYTSEKRSLDARSVGVLDLPGDPVIPVVPEVVASKTFNKATYRGAIEFKPTTSALLYASINTGFKSGGFNVTQPADPYYRPETLTAYEIGEKVDLFNRMVRINSAAFYYDYKDIQVQRAGQASTGFINGASAHIYGFDGDLTVVPTSALKLTAGVSILNAKYRDFKSAPEGSPGGGVPVTVADASGNRIPYSPKATFNMVATYTIPVGDNQIVLNGNYLHSSSFFFEPDNIVLQKAYDTFNALLRYEFDRGKYSVALFGRNITDRAIKSVVLTIPSGQQIQLLQPPRTYGVTFGVKL